MGIKGKNGMRLLFVTTEFVTEDYFYGGLSNYTYRITKKLSELGHEVHVITCSTTDETAFDYNGIRIHRVSISPLPLWIRLFSRESAEGSTGQRIYFNIKVFNKVREIHRKAPLDIIQFTNVFASGLLTGLFLSVPYVIRASSYRPTWYESEGNPHDLEHRSHEWLEWLQMRLCKAIYTPSRKLKKILEDEMRIKDVRVIRPAVYLETNDWDTSAFNRLLKDKDYLLFFGRFQIRKGFHILAQALPDFLKKNPNAHVVCVGHDYGTRIASSMQGYIKSLCGDYADRLMFIDQKRHGELYPIISGAKVVVLPSLIENLPNACLEAMFLGKPVVGTFGTSFEELIVEGENGFLVPPGDVKALTSKLDEAWNHSRLKEIGCAAKKKIQEFSPENTVQDLLGYFKEVM